MPNAVTVIPCRSSTVDGSAFVTSTTPTSRLTPSTRAAQRATEHLKGAIFLIEEATEERRKAWRHVVAGRPGNGQRFLARLIA